MILEEPPKRGNMDRQVGILNERVWPDSFHQLLFLHELAVALEENCKCFSSLGGELNHLVILKEQMLGGIEVERPKLIDDFFVS